MDNRHNNQSESHIKKPQTRRARSNSTHNSRKGNESPMKNSLSPKNSGGSSSIPDGVKVEPKPAELGEMKKNLSHSKRPKSVTEASGAKRKNQDESKSSSRLSNAFPVHVKNIEDRKSMSSSGSVLSRDKRKSPIKMPKKEPITHKIEMDEMNDSLLMMAVAQQNKITEIMDMALDNLHQKLRDVRSGKTELDDNSPEQPPATPEKNLSMEPRRSCFMGSYRSSLDEIFQAWFHLFYFIYNLRIKLIQVVNDAGAEPFAPSIPAEKNIITQAIECVKFYTKLKMKSMTESFEDMMHSSESQILELEKNISSPFLTEMNYMGKKAKDMIATMLKDGETTRL